MHILTLDCFLIRKLFLKIKMTKVKFFERLKQKFFFAQFLVFQFLYHLLDRGRTNFSSIRNAKDYNLLNNSEFCKF